jgi:hypothetical protein
LEIIIRQKCEAENEHCMYFRFLADVIPRGIDEMLLDAYLSETFAANKEHVLFRTHKHAMLPTVAPARRLLVEKIEFKSKLRVVEVVLDCGIQLS